VAVNQQHPTPLSLIALCVPRKNYSGTRNIRQGPDVGALTERQEPPRVVMPLYTRLLVSREPSRRSR
jgi:hypothetical protein